MTSSLSFQQCSLICCVNDSVAVAQTPLSSYANELPMPFINSELDLVVGPQASVGWIRYELSVITNARVRDGRSTESTVVLILRAPIIGYDIRNLPMPTCCPGPELNKIRHRRQHYLSSILGPQDI